MATNAKMQAKCLCNASAKQEMFSLKQALAAVKNAYDAKADGVREYITDTLGIGAKRLKDLQWTGLQEYAKAGKTGRYSTWAVLNALPKWYAAVGGNLEKEAVLLAASRKANAAKKAAKAKDEKAA